MITFSKKHLLDIANNCEGVEIYEFKEYGEHRVHTDTVDFLDISVGALPEEVTCDFYEMDAEEYNNTLYANCGEYADYEGKLLVIVLPHNWEEE